jgi:hypothetical protein
MHGESWGGAAPLRDSAIHIMSRARPGAWRATVNGMLPDFRFAFGAMLAIAVLAVTGLGLVTSVRLMHEARIDPIEDARSLAFAGHAEWNRSYDPAGAQRFGGLADNPLADVRPDAAAENPPISSAAIEQPGSEERTTSSAEQRPEPDTVADDAPVTADAKLPEKTPETDPARTQPPPAAETAAAVTTPAPLREAAAKTPGDPSTTGSVAPPAEEVASAPATLTERETQAETRSATQMPAQETALAPPQAAADPPPDSSLPTPQAAADPPPDSSPATPQAAADPPPDSSPATPQAATDPPPDPLPPTPRARPKAHLQRRIARVRRRSVVPPSPQPVQNSGWPLASPPSSSQSWPGYDNQFTGATAKKTGKLSATPAARPQ